MTHVQVNEISPMCSSDASFMANKSMMTQIVNPSSTCNTTAVINPVLENGITVRQVADYEVSTGWSEHKDMAFPPSIDDFCSHRSLKQNGEEIWAKEYSSNHKILLVGEGDFSFSASLAAAFGSASNMTATSLDSEMGLWKVHDRAVYNIGELQKKGCKVIHGVNVTAMASHPCLKGLTFDRIIFNFPFATISKKKNKSRLRPHNVLVKAFLKAAREMISENGEIHITQRTDGILGEMRIEFLAFKQWLELVGVADFNACDYLGYSPKWEIGNGYNLDYCPSKIYKFRRPHPPMKIIPIATTKSASSTLDYVPKFSNVASSSSDSAIVRIAPFKMGVEKDNSTHNKDIEISTKLLKSITLEEKEITSPPSRNCYANHYLKQNDMGQEKWVKHYSSSHKMLLVGEGDFSFSASLAAAFGSASNMTATTFNSRKVLKKDFNKAVYNIKELKRMGCKVMHCVDATAMETHPRLKGSTFDRIIFNFPYAYVSFSSMLGGLAFEPCQHQNLVREFLENAKKMIGKNGEIHITHRIDGEYGAWKIDFIASQQGLELIETVDFSIADYPGYNAKWGLGGDYDFDWFPSKTYKFRHPHPPRKILSSATHPEPASFSIAPNFLTNVSNFDVAPPCIKPSLILPEYPKEFCYDLNFNLQPDWCMSTMYQSPSMMFPYGEAAACSVYTAQQYHHSFLPPREYCTNYNMKQNEKVIKTGVVVGEEKWIKHYSNRHKMLIVGDGDFSFSASLAVAFGSASNMTATSLDSEEFLTLNYCKAFLHLKELKKRGCKVIHGVDATAMAYHPSLMGSTFDRIVFNFPYAGFFNDSPRKSKIGCHQNLIWMFLENAKQMMGENGEIHITHKTNGFHGQWNIVSLAIQQGLELVDSVKFNVSDYPGYSNKYGFGGDNSFDCAHSKTYMFRHSRTAYMSWPWGLGCS